MVHFNIGPTRWDPVGQPYGKMCFPFIPFGKSVNSAERFYTAGNERSAFNYNPNGDTGYHLKTADKFSYLVELMNMNMEDKVVYVTMTYDYLPGDLPKGWGETKSVWLDANQCSTSEVRAPKENGTFTIESKRWKPNFEGKVISAMGHLHDGGKWQSFSLDASLFLTIFQYRRASRHSVIANKITLQDRHFLRRDTTVRLQRRRNDG